MSKFKVQILLIVMSEIFFAMTVNFSLGMFALTNENPLNQLSLNRKVKIPLVLISFML